MSDVDRAVSLLRLLAGDAGPVVTFVDRAAPVPKARARWSPRNNRWYTPTTSKDAEQALMWRFREAFVGRQPFQDTVAIVTLFFVETSTKHEGDGDNLQKLVLDAGTKARAWKDDLQVKASTWIVDLDPENPRTVVALCPYVCALMKAPLLTTTGAM